MLEIVDAGNLVREAVREWVPQAIERRIDLGVDIGAGPAQILGSPLMLREMLGNLIDNALRYTPAGGAVTVRVLRSEAAVIVEVEDTGHGIPESERRRVFDRFYRVLGTQVEGSGLGLAIVREIAEQHEARVSIHTPARAAAAALPGTIIRVEFTRTPPGEPAGARGRGPARI